MATVDFTVTRIGRRGPIRASEITTSGQDTITTVENIEDASGDISLGSGSVLAIYSTAALRIAFGGVAATGTTGHYIPATTLIEIEVTEDGTVSAIEAT